jgi:galactokinase
MDTEDDFIDIFKNLENIYDFVGESIDHFHIERIEGLKTKFQTRYGSLPKYISRAPGRVNLIGEHIDYMGYGVFPFALEQDTLIAFSLTECHDINISHTNPIKYPDVKLSADPNQDFDGNHAYYNYILAGYFFEIITFYL